MGLIGAETVQHANCCTPMDKAEFKLGVENLEGQNSPHAASTKVVRASYGLELKSLRTTFKGGLYFGDKLGPFAAL